MTVEVPDFTDRQATMAWLLTQPRTVSEVMAVRAALWSLPTLWRAARILGDDLGRVLVLPVLRATTSPFLASGLKVAGEADRARADAFAARTAAADAAAAVASSRAADGAYAAYAAATAIAADAYGAADAAALAGAAGIAANANVDAVSSGLDARLILDCPLWSETASTTDGTAPAWVLRAWRSLRVHLDAREDEGWRVWTDWYDARLRGDPIDWELERARLQPPEVWEAGPKVLNEAILRRMEELLAERADADPGLAQISRWIVDLRSAQGGLQHAPSPVARSLDEAEARAALIEAIEKAAASLAGGPPPARGIGDNNPPPEARLRPEDFDDLQRQLSALSKQLRIQNTPPEEIAEPVKEVATIWERASGLFADEFAKSYGKTLGVSAAAATTAALGAVAVYAGDVLFAEAFTAFIERLGIWVSTLRAT